MKELKHLEDQNRYLGVIHERTRVMKRLLAHLQRTAGTGEFKTYNDLYDELFPNENQKRGE